MILPLTKDRLTLKAFPWLSLAIIILNLLVFVLVWPRLEQDQQRVRAVVDELKVFEEDHPGMAREDFESLRDLRAYQSLIAQLEKAQSEHVFRKYGFVPARPTWSGLVGSLFLHASWLHLLGNLYLLWLCGGSLETLWGRPAYAVVYLAAGAAAVLFHGALDPESLTPLVGASGAIAGLMGVFLLRLFRTPVRFGYVLFYRGLGTFSAPAWTLLLLWLAHQLVSAVFYSADSPVAFWAHLGGFGLGAAIALFVRLTLLEEAFRGADTSDSPPASEVGGQTNRRTNTKTSMV